jgi:cytochrome c biogenesis protein CcdA
MLAIIFAAGILHGLGPDHLAAITAVAGVGSGFHRITACALRFAAGHAVVIAAAGAAALAGRQLLPVGWEIGFDVLAGTVLILGGMVFVVALARGRVTMHQHVHSHRAVPHRHVHLHFKSTSRHRHVHDLGSVMLGALFALGGSRTVLAVAPVALAHNLAESCLRIAAFAAGIVIAMVFFGAAAAKFLRSSAFSLKRLGFVTGALCIAAGTWTIASRLHH